MGQQEKGYAAADSEKGRKRNEMAAGRFSDPSVHGNRSGLNIREVMERIRAAHPVSPIVVYRGVSPDAYGTAFAATVRGQNDLERGYSKRGERVLGAWHSGDSEATIRAVLTSQI